MSDRKQAPVIPTFCVHGREAELKRFSSVIAAVAERQRRFGIILAPRDAASPDHLARLYPKARIIAPPTAIARVGVSWARRLKVKCFIALGDAGDIDPRFLPGLRRSAVPIVVLSASHGGHDPSGSVEHFIVGTANLHAQQSTVIEGLSQANGPDASSVEAVIEALTPFVARHAALARSRRRTILHRIENVALKSLSGWAIRRIESLDALRDALGSPETILCVGNGPSSEDPKLLDFRYDSLFRVNHRWIDRGFLAEPGMVFTGSTKSFLRVHRSIVGFSGKEIEAMLLRKWLPYALYRRLTYFTPERAGLLASNAEGILEPTNGAIMLSTAIALAPRRLGVAGIDLFSDERGAYPGGDATANAYAAAHHLATERHRVLTLLDSYRGELVIFGDVLRNAWRARAEQRALSAE